MNDIVLNDVKDIHQLFRSHQYTLQEKIAEGSFGQVYLAKQINTGQTVVIKFLTLNQHLDEARKQRCIDRFNRETTLCSQLNHSNIVHLYDKGQCGTHLLYAVFDNAEGISLKEWLAKKGPMEPAAAVDIMLQVLDGLAYAHAKGVIHRNINPSNILVTQSQTLFRVQILDFGMGTLREEVRYDNHTNSALNSDFFGSPSYLAPEQLRGESPTPKTDLYLWGLLFLECLTGYPAVRGSSMAEIFRQQLSEHDVPLPTTLVDHPLGALLRSTLCKQNQERHGQARELFQQLQSLSTRNVTHAVSTSEISHDAISNDELTTIDTANNLINPLLESTPITALALSLQVRVTAEVPCDQEIIDVLYHDQKSQVIATAIRYGGFHAGSLGDVALIYFGYPSALDNDARLCARAALDIISLQSNRNTTLSAQHGFYLEVRLAIHTGRITVSDDHAPEGETPNLALALCRNCNAGQILCSVSTQRILSTYVEAESKKELDVGYRLQPMPVYAVLGERSVEAFGFLRGSRKKQQLIGRQNTLSVLLNACKEASLVLQNVAANANTLASSHSNNTNPSMLASVSGAKAMHLQGEAGNGKSRLIFELLDNMNHLPQSIGQCLPGYHNIPLYPILRLVKYKLSLDGLSDELMFAGIVDFINQTRGRKRLTQRKSLPILLAWLNVTLPEEVLPSTEAPDVQKSLLFGFISDILLNGEYDSSHLFVIEDIHWADDTTLAFLRVFIPTALQTGNVVISTSRESLPSQLSGLSYQHISVDKLSPDETKAMVHALLNAHSIESSLLQQLIARTDGHPLFVEEWIAVLQQQKLIHQINGELALIDPNQEKAMPVSLQEALQYKLDTVPNAKETAELAAAIGREFDYKLLIAASTKSEEQVQQDLNELVSAGILFKQRRVDGDMYFFKHALVRDAAYASALPRQRIAYHRHIALVLSSDNEHANQNALLIAQHFIQAKEPHYACDYGDIAIEKQVANRAYQEAQRTFDTMIAVANDIHEPFQQAVRWVQLKSAFLPALAMIEGWHAGSILPFSNSILADVSKVCTLSGEPGGFEHYEHLAEQTRIVFHHYQGERQQMRQWGEALLSKVLRSGDRQKELTVRAVLGQAYLLDGDLVQARQMLSRVMEIYHQKADISLHYEIGLDPFQLATGNLMYLEALTGNLVKAEKYYHLSIEYASKTDNISILLMAYTFGVGLFFLLNDKQKMNMCSNEAIKYCGDEIRTNDMYQRLQMMHNWTSNEYLPLAASTAKDTVSERQSWLSWSEPLLCDSYLAQGKVEDAIVLMTASIDRLTQSGEEYNLGIYYRYLANAFYAENQSLNEKSLHYYQLAIDEAKTRGSLWLQLLASFELLRREPSTDMTQTLVNDISILILQIEGIETSTWYQPITQMLQKYNNVC